MVQDHVLTGIKHHGGDEEPRRNTSVSSYAISLLHSSAT